MSRELKFRALWENLKTGERRWSYYGIGTKPILTGAKWITDDLQYTGLKDKNGVEIYDGDVYTNGRFNYGVQWNDKEAGWRDQYGHKLPKLFGAIDCEVIGNIYENPELLEEAHND